MAIEKKVKTTLEDRENKRKQSIVSSFQSDESTEEKVSEKNSNIESEKFFSISFDPQEKRSKGISVRITPTTYDRLQKKSKKLNTSVNEIINKLLDSFVDE